MTGTLFQVFPNELRTVLHRKHERVSPHVKHVRCEETAVKTVLILRQYLRKLMISDVNLCVGLTVKLCCSFNGWINLA
jgi:hypothetical protein